MSALKENLSESKVLVYRWNPQAAYLIVRPFTHRIFCFKMLRLRFRTKQLMQVLEPDLCPKFLFCGSRNGCQAKAYLTAAMTALDLWKKLIYWRVQQYCQVTNKNILWCSKILSNKVKAYKVLLSEIKNTSGFKCY